jgi:hypothetical protein
MWYLIEDFFEQSWIMKLFLIWGWVSVVIMALSLWDTAPALFTALFPPEAAVPASPSH